MMLHLALLASSASIDMAYNIRRYKQGDAKSYHQIYIANHNGSGIKRVSKGNQIHAVSPIWIDRNHLAWVEQFDPAPIKNDPNIYFRDCKARIMVYDLASKATKKLADLPTLSWREYPRASGRRLDAWRTVSNNEVRSYHYEISLKGINEISDGIRDTPEFGTKIGEDTDEISAPRKATVYFGKKELKLSWKTPHPKPGGFEDVEAMKNSTVELEAVWKGRESKITLRGNHVVQSFIAKDGTGIILTDHRYDRSLRPNYLYRSNKSFSKCKLLSRDIGPMILSPDRRYWHAHQVGQDFVAGELLDDGRVVDVSSLYTGDWTTGKQ